MATRAIQQAIPSCLCTTLLVRVHQPRHCGVLAMDTILPAVDNDATVELLARFLLIFTFIIGPPRT